MPLWQPIGEQELLRALRNSKVADRQSYNEEVRRAVDYWEDRQIDDTRQLLLQRYSKSQTGDTGQGIYPVTLPITERYVAEAANAYNRPVTRELVNDAGEVQDDPTKILNDHLRSINYDETMHLNECLTVLLGVNAVWYQVKRGALRPVITVVDDLYPLAQADAVGEDGVAADPKDQDDYAGFIVQLVHAIDDISRVMPGEFALVTAPEVLYYKARDPYDMQSDTLRRVPSPFRWPQKDYRGNAVDAPLQMLTVWHKRLPTRSLLKSQDVSIVNANRELNVQWSLLFDTIRLQGWATTVLNLMNPAAAPSSMTHGARFPLVLAAGESATALTYNAPYTQIVDVLKTYSKLLAIALRASPNDFSIDQSSAVSGFAKLVDSLPKIEARNERLVRLKHTEEVIAWPRIGAALEWLGILRGASKLKMRVKFAELEFPKTEQEKSQEIETDFKHGLDSPIDVIMRRRGVSREEAEEILAKNKEHAQTPQQDQMPQPTDARGLMSAMIRKRQSDGMSGANGGMRKMDDMKKMGGMGGDDH